MHDQMQAHEHTCPFSREDLIRRESLEFAIGSKRHDHTHEDVLTTARAYEAYLKGE